MSLEHRRQLAWDFSALWWRLYPWPEGLLCTEAVLQRMLLVLRNRKSSPEQLPHLQKWSKEKKVSEAPFHKDTDHTCYALCSDFATKSQHLVYRVLPKANSSWVPTVCPGLYPEGRRGELRKSHCPQEAHCLEGKHENLNMYADKSLRGGRGGTNIFELLVHFSLSRTALCRLILRGSFLWQFSCLLFILSPCNLGASRLHLYVSCIIQSISRSYIGGLGIHPGLILQTLPSRSSNFVSRGLRQILSEL